MLPAERNINKDCMAERNAEVASYWTSSRKSDNTHSTSIFDENIGEDGLSSQSTYDMTFKDMFQDRVNSISSNQKLLDPFVTDSDLLKENYSILAKAVYELGAHHSQTNTLKSLI